ncbi:MAG TPA: uroporphyrinogen-III synthase [Brevundimonas sp.]|uniref:uroporphyrinogen-III synthase n=1 Tax=Brevundimonas sp. TaxID=1871086 RepID=UPI002DF4A300|nr:uroporphyrinogen-III synthase [Brevundimonas sp.]
MRVWITRTEPGAARTARAVADLGHVPVVAPVLEVHDLPGPVPPHEAVAFTSPNAVAAFARLSGARSARVFAVGDATARAAAEAGFADVASAAGDGHALAALIAADPPGALLWPRAAEPAFDLASALTGVVEVRAAPVYETRPVDPLAAPDFDLVLVHSPRAARVLAAGLSPDAAQGRRLAAISAAAAAPLGALPWAALHVAAHPDEAHLLAPLGKPPPAV